VPGRERASLERRERSFQTSVFGVETYWEEERETREDLEGKEQERKQALDHHRASFLTPREQEGMIEEEVVHHRLDYRSDREGDLFDQGPRVAHGKPIDYDDEAGGSQRGGWHHSVWSAGGVLVPAVLLLAAGVSLPGWLVVCVFAMICARIRLRPAQTVFPKPPPFLST
jgi:hypothetical protein